MHNLCYRLEYCAWIEEIYYHVCFQYMFLKDSRVRHSRLSSCCPPWGSDTRHGKGFGGFAYVS